MTKLEIYAFVLALVFDVTLASLPNDVCSGAIDLALAYPSPIAGPLTGSTVGASTEEFGSTCDGNETFYNDIWYKYTLWDNFEGELDALVNLCGSDPSFDIIVGIYYFEPGVDPCETPNVTYTYCESTCPYAVCNGYAPSTTFPCLLPDPLFANDTIYVRIGGTGPSEMGSYRLTIDAGDDYPWTCELANVYQPGDALTVSSAALIIFGYECYLNSACPDGWGSETCDCYFGNRTSPNLEPVCSDPVIWEMWFALSQDTFDGDSLLSFCNYLNPTFEGNLNNIVLELYDSCDLSNQTEHLVGCSYNDSTSCSYGANYGTLFTTLEPGQLYWLRVGFTEDLTAAEDYIAWFQFQEAFLNDQCNTAAPLALDDFGFVSTLNFDTGVSSPVLPQAQDDITFDTYYNSRCGAKNYLAASLWFSWTAPSTATIVDISLCGSRTNFDTMLEIWDHCPEPTYDSLDWMNNSIACNDNNPICGGVGTASALYGINVVPGVTYYLRVGSSYEETYGQFQLTIQPSGGSPECVSSNPLDTSYLTLEAFLTSNTVFPDGITEPCISSDDGLYDVWFDVLAPATTSYWFQACDFFNSTESGEAHISVYSTSRSLCPVSSDDSSRLLCFASTSCSEFSPSVNLTGGKHYRLRVGVTENGTAGAFSMLQRETIFTSFENDINFEYGEIFEVHPSLAPVAITNLSLAGFVGSSSGTVYMIRSSIDDIPGSANATTPFYDTSDWVVVYDGTITFAGVANLGVTITFAEPIWVNESNSVLSFAIICVNKYIVMGPDPDSSTHAYDGKFANPDIFISATAYPLDVYTPTTGQVWPGGSSRGLSGRDINPSNFFTLDRTGPSYTPMLLLNYYDPVLHPTTPNATSSHHGGGLSNGDVADIAVAASVGGVFGIVLIGAALCLGCLACCIIVPICLVIAFCLIVIVVVVLIVIVIVALVAVVGSIAGVSGGTGATLAKFRKEKKQFDLDLMNFLDMNDEDEGADLKFVLLGAGVRSGRFREIKWEELHFRQKLGEGAYGKVYRARWREADVAVKTINLVNVADLNFSILDEFRAEASLMELLGNHPNVISFVGAVTAGGHLALVTEYCARGSLFDLLYNGRIEFSDYELLVMARDVASAVDHLHSEGVIHRDLAARNILIAHDCTVRVSDFGMSRVISKAGQATTNTTRNNVGPVKWMAPESIRRKIYSEKTDAFMFGVLLWEMWTREDPYEGMSLLEVAVGVSRENLRLSIPSETECDPVVIEVMNRVWEEEPEKRPSFSEIGSLFSSRVAELMAIGADKCSDSSEDDGSETQSAGSIGIPMAGETVTYVIPTTLLKSDMYKIPYEHIKFFEVIGRSAFRTVYRGEWHNRAVTITQLEAPSNDVVDEFLDDMAKLAKAGKRSNVNSFYGIAIKGDKLWLLTDYCSQGSIDSLLRASQDTLTEDQLLKYALDAARGVSRLHREGIVHGDISCRSFLLHDLNGVVVTDFGLTRLLEAIPQNDGMKKFSSERVRWMAPESISNGVFDAMSDCYMFGMFLYELFCRHVPFYKHSNLELLGDKILHGLRPKILSAMPAELSELCMKLWSDEPNDRTLMRRVVVDLTKLLSSKTPSSVHTIDVVKCNATTTAAYDGLPDKISALHLG